jgi:uncharacterized damage-inducible protein DinB
MKNHLLKLIEAERWANDLLAETIEKSNESDERTLLLFSHLLSSYSMWLSRVKGTEITTTLFQERNLEESKTLKKQVFSDWKTYLELASNEELNRVVHFVFPLDGTKRKLSVTDAVLHLVTHSSYHRGQIMARLKNKIEVLPLTTYIAFAMEKDEE